GRLGRKQLSPSRSLLAANLEHVAEIRTKKIGERQFRLALAEIGQNEHLVQAAVPEKACALNVNDAFRRRLSTDRRKRMIGQMGREEDIVLRDVAAEKRDAVATDQETKTGENAGVVAKEAVGVAVDIAETIGDEKHVALLQDVLLLCRNRRSKRVRLRVLSNCRLCRLQHGSDCTDSCAHAPVLECRTADEARIDVKIAL